MDENNEVLGGESIESEFEDWSDIDTSNLTDESDENETEGETEADEAEADQPETGEAEEEAEENPEEKTEDGQKEEQKEPDQTFELKHLDETRTVNREEVIQLAQKGLDYDRIRGKLDELRGLEKQAGENELYAEFVKELADGAGISVEQMIDSTRARILVDKAGKQGQTLDMKDALAQAKQTREARNQLDQQSREMREQRNKQDRFREEANRFRMLYPDVKAEEIPPEVWADYDRGGNLADAWNKNQMQQLRTENETLRRELDGLKQEKKNEQRSTGSRKSAGASQRSKVDDAWEEALKNEW